MHVILEPVSHPHLDDVVVTGTLFPIGRQEVPFRDYDKALVAKLSKRHARLFEQDGRAYIADLGSLNGTRRNGEPLQAQAVALAQGDTIGFGGLTYRVARISAAETEITTAAPTAAIRLVLTPERLEDTLEPIVVSSFPFLFDKSAEPFSRYREVLPDELAYMSRRHAHIFERGEALCIEDLGSTNGTFVSGVRLDEHARVLVDDDTIALGSDRLMYRVHLLSCVEEGTTQVPSVQALSLSAGIESLDPMRTIFVDSPTSFLDVYFVADGASAEPFERNGRDAAAEPTGDGAVHARGLLAVLLEAKRSIFGEQMFRPAARRGLAALVVVGAAVAGAAYWQGRPVREIETALEREQFADALALAAAQLERDPDDAELRTLATRAFVLDRVPRWLAHLEQGRLDEAAALIERARESAEPNPEAMRMRELLDWITRTRGFLAAESADNALNAVLASAGETASLLEWWQRDDWAHNRMLTRIGTLLPSFRATADQVFRDVRELRARHLDDQPIVAFRGRLIGALAADTPDALRTTEALISDFRRGNPRVQGSDALSSDLQRLARLRAHLDAGRWLDARRQLESEPFVTLPFREHVAELQRTSLPDEAVMAAFDDVHARWRGGDTQGALARLDTLTEGRWAAPARELASRYRALLDARAALQAARGEPGYPERLFTFYASLDESRDAFLVRGLEGEFRVHAEAAVVRAATDLDLAATAWADYRSSGGIQPRHRLESGVSDEFTTRAQTLVRARVALQRVARIHEQVGRSLPAEWGELNGLVARELSAQRSALQNLEVIEPSVRRRKLELLAGA